MRKQKNPFIEMPRQQRPLLPQSSAKLVVGQEVTHREQVEQARGLVARHLLGMLALLLAVVMALGLAQPARAETFEVPCWPGTLLSMKTAIENANETPGHDVILFTSQCTVQVFGQPTNYGHGSVFFPQITEDLTIIGAGSKLVRVDDDRFRLLESANGVKLTIENLTLQNGEADFAGALYAGGPLALTQVTMQTNTANGIGGYGGAIYATSSVVISASTFLTNNANVDGGAIYALGDVVVDGQSRFTGNQASSNGGAMAGTGRLTVRHTYFDRNKAFSAGGALYAKEPVSIAKSQFDWNHANNGGALYVEAPLDVAESNFTHNSADVSGGAVAVFGAATFIKSGFDGNSTSEHSGSGLGGGAIYATDQVVVEGGAFADNKSGYYGGAIYAAGRLSVELSRFARNESVYGGGTIYSLGPYQVATSTFRHNESGDGGAIFGEAEGSVIETTFASNSAYQGGAIYGNGKTEIISSTLESNIAGVGGGLIALAEVHIHASHFISNTSTDGYVGGGGAIIVNGEVIGTEFRLNHSQADGGALLVVKDAQIKGNVFVENQANGSGGAVTALQIESPANLVMNNLFLNNHASQGAAVAIIELRSGAAAIAQVDANQVSIEQAGGVTTLVHNTIVRTTPGGTSAVYISLGTLTLQSNIITNYSIGAAAAGGSITADYNLFFGNGVNYSGINGGANDLNGEPHFVDASQGNYRLSAGSPAIDSAAPPGVAEDLDKKARPQGNGFDRGAYEYTPEEAPISGLSISHSGPTELGKVTYFSATVATGDNVTYFWDFGDGSGEQGQYITHTYTQTGIYTGVVTAQNLASRAHITFTVEVVPPAEQPDDENPDGEEPDPDDEPDDDNPGDDEPGDDNPGDDNPGDDTPDDDNPADDDPNNDNPGDDNSGGDNPNDDPNNDNPGDDEPNDDNPGNDNPGGDEPGDDNPGDDTPNDDEPNDDNPGDDDPNDDNPGDDNSGDDTPDDPNPDNDNPGGDNPNDDDPDGDNPGSDNPNDGDPADDDPNDDNPGNDNPGGDTNDDEPIDVDPDDSPGNEFFMYLPLTMR